MRNLLSAGGLRPYRIKPPQSCLITKSQEWGNAAGIRRQRQYTQAEKEQFHTALDRTGSIVTTAWELGLNIGTAHSWAGRINPAARKPRNTTSVKTSPAQRYSPAVIEEFLSVLREIGSVSAAAKQLGLNRSTCSNWAIDAGMSSTCPVNAN
ncbi:hypothetical protein [Specibacter sp. RAF43]|uniref:hypothetical protein n=1 Tax=Specibacter sp. RAF43 TaxID=3233057 RepID=UPI003F9E0AE5